MNRLRATLKTTKTKPPIFSGDASRDMWKLLHRARTVADLRGALYLICCRIQDLEGRTRRRSK